MSDKKVYIKPDELNRFIQPIVEEVKKQLITDKVIRLDANQREALAKVTAKHLSVEIDYSKIPKPKDGIDGKNLVWDGAIRADVIEGVKRLIHNPKHEESYKLTAQDRADIAEQAVRLLPEPNSQKTGLDEIVKESIKQEIIDSIIEEAQFVSKIAFNRRLKDIKTLIDQVKGKRPMNTGISGKDMVEEINKILGTSWQEFDDSNLVHLDGTETITGLKSFQALLGVFNGLLNVDREQIRLGRSDNMPVRYHSVHTKASAGAASQNYVRFKVHDRVTDTSQVDVFGLYGNKNAAIGTMVPIANSTGGTLLLGMNDAVQAPAGTVTGGGLLYMVGGKLFNLDSAGVVHDLTATGISWGEIITNGSGIGLAFNVGAGAASGVNPIKVLFDNGATNALEGITVDIGTAAAAHIGFRATGGGNNSSQAHYLAEILAAGRGTGFWSNHASTESLSRSFRLSSTTNNVNGIGQFFSVVSPNNGAFQPINITMSSSAITEARTTDFALYSSARKLTALTTLSDNYDMVHFLRTTTVDRTGSTYNANGAVVKIENKAVEDSGTLNDSVVVLELVQDVDSEGSPIRITQNATIAGLVSGTFKKYKDLDGLLIYKSDGTTPQGNLDATKGATQGAICYNGPGGQPFYFTGTGSNWTGM
jgi:hypothetical protein